MKFSRERFPSGWNFDRSDHLITFYHKGKSKIYKNLHFTTKENLQTSTFYNKRKSTKNLYFTIEENLQIEKFKRQFMQFHLETKIKCSSSDVENILRVLCFWSTPSKRSLWWFNADWAIGKTLWNYFEPISLCIKSAHTIPT